MALPYFFSIINPSTIVLGSLFLTFLALLSYILSKVFRDKYGNVNKVTVGIISFCISVLIIYFGKETIYNIIEALRFSNIILYILSGAVVLFLVYCFRKTLKFCVILMLIGAGLILIGALTEWFYQKWFIIVLGVIFLLASVWLCIKKPQKNQPTYSKTKRKKNQASLLSKTKRKKNQASLLIKEAKRFRKKALKSDNPKFYGGWAHFVHHLKKTGYGRNEQEIINNFNVTKKQFLKIFKRYGIVK